jgi:hypothetical protein
MVSKRSRRLPRRLIGAPRGRVYNKPEQPPQFVCRTIARLFVQLCQAPTVGAQAIVNIKN